MPDLELRCLRRPVTSKGARHASVLVAQALGWLIPLLAIVAIFAPGNAGGSERVHTLFADSGEVESALTWVGMIILALVTLSCAGAVQRVFQRAYGQEPGGIAEAPLRSALLGGLALWMAIESPLRQALDGVGGVLCAIALGSAIGGVFWLWMPLTLLRIKDWRRLLPAALLFGALGASLVVSGFYIPILTERSVERYGLIGLAFAVQSWLLLFVFVISIGVVGGRDRHRWRPPTLEANPGPHGPRGAARSRIGHLRADSGLLSRAVRSHRRRLHAPAGAARVRICDRDRRPRLRGGHRGAGP